MSDLHQSDTIAAIATASSEAGIGIIRISGPAAGNIIFRLFRSSSQIPNGIGKEASFQGLNNGTEGVSPCDSLVWKANTIHYGYIVDPDSLDVLDEVLVSWMRAPHSYTTEDTAEINTHGGRYVMQKVLSAVLRAGARAAEPGEFTKRAFLNGRVDLSEAEAVMDLIHSQTEFARKCAISQLNGAISSSIRSLRSEILYELAFIESALDDPEHFSLDGYSSSLDEKCKHWLDILHRWILSSENGQILREGICTVIVGRPNVGKSSLLNALSGRDRAIVTDIPGTTRDTLEETIRLGDLCLRLIDTAGIRDARDEVERVGVERSLRALDSAQLIFFLLDSSQKLSQEDQRIASLTEDAICSGAKCVILLNKSDLPLKTDASMVSSLYSNRLSGEMFPEIVSLSLKNGEGLPLLENCVLRMFLKGDIAETSEMMVSGERQISELREAQQAISLVRDGIRTGVSEEFYTIDLQNAYASLGRILGEALGDDLIDEIFSRFCMGK